MTNGDYNPFFRPEGLPNDRRQSWIVLIGLAVAALIAVVLILFVVR